MDDMLTKSNELSLFSCNKMAQNSFGIKTSATFNNFIQKLQISLGESVFNSKVFDQLTFKRSVVNLRDYLLARHSKMQRENTKNLLSKDHMSFKVKFKEILNKLQKLRPTTTILSSHTKLLSQFEEDQRINGDFVSGIGQFIHLLEEKPAQTQELSVDYMHCIANIEGIQKEFKVSVFKYKGGPSGAESPLLILCIDEVKRNDFRYLKEQILESRHFILNVLNYFAFQFKEQLAELSQHVQMASAEQKEEQQQEYLQEQEICMKIPSNSPRTPTQDQPQNQAFSQLKSDQHNLPSCNTITHSEKIFKLLNVCYNSQVIALQSIIQASNFSDCFRYKENKPLPLSISQFSLSELLLKAFSFFTDTNQVNRPPQLFYQATNQTIRSDHRRVLQVVFNILAFLRSKTHGKITFCVIDQFSEEYQGNYQDENGNYSREQEKQQSVNRQDCPGSQRNSNRSCFFGKQKRNGIDKEFSQNQPNYSQGNNHVKDDPNGNENQGEIEDDASEKEDYVDCREIQQQSLGKEDKGKKQLYLQHQQSLGVQEFKENIESSNMFIKTDLEESQMMYPQSRIPPIIPIISLEQDKSMQGIKEISYSSSHSSESAAHLGKTKTNGNEQSYQQKKLLKREKDLIHFDGTSDDAMSMDSRNFMRQDRVEERKENVILKRGFTSKACYGRQPNNETKGTMTGFGRSLTSLKKENTDSIQEKNEHFQDAMSFRQFNNAQDQQEQQKISQFSKSKTDRASPVKPCKEVTHSKSLAAKSIQNEQQHKDMRKQSQIPGDVLRMSVAVKGESILWPEQSVGSEQIQMLATNEIIKLLGPNKSMNISREQISFDLFMHLPHASNDIDGNIVSQAESFEELINLSQLLDDNTAKDIAIKDNVIKCDILSAKSSQMLSAKEHRIFGETDRNLKQLSKQKSISASNQKQVFFSAKRQQQQQPSFSNFNSEIQQKTLKYAMSLKKSNKINMLNFGENCKRSSTLPSSGVASAERRESRFHGNKFKYNSIPIPVGSRTQMRFVSSSNSPKKIKTPGIFHHSDSPNNKDHTVVQENPPEFIKFSVSELIAKKDSIP